MKPETVPTNFAVPVIIHSHYVLLNWLCYPIFFDSIWPMITHRNDSWLIGYLFHPHTVHYFSCCMPNFIQISFTIPGYGMPTIIQIFHYRSLLHLHLYYQPLYHPFLVDMTVVHKSSVFVYCVCRLPSIWRRVLNPCCSWAFQRWTHRFLFGWSCSNVCEIGI